MRNAGLFIGISLLILSCRGEVKEVTNRVGEGIALTLLDEDTTGMTSFTLDKVLHDFGTIPSGPTVSCEFVITNEENNPLLISNFKTSCGCLIPEWPKMPIPVGETGILRLTFMTKGRSGKQHKSAVITANTIPENHWIRITSNLKN